MYVHLHDLSPPSAASKRDSNELETLPLLWHEVEFGRTKCFWECLRERLCLVRGGEGSGWMDGWTRIVRSFVLERVLLRSIHCSSSSAVYSPREREGEGEKSRFSSGLGLVISWRWSPAYVVNRRLVVSSISSFFFIFPCFLEKRAKHRNMSWSTCSFFWRSSATYCYVSA